MSCLAGELPARCGLQKAVRREGDRENYVGTKKFGKFMEGEAAGHTMGGGGWEGGRGGMIRLEKNAE